ncbi:MAG: DUF3990 domain-containing protein [Pseudobutyrivibrio sp.]|uniref:DUF3990 domain-containing protein n=1 Tax=Pseudobutyrivibrio sp. TaxID=2014367 RepID=UPI0025D35732|nr:DUF3990 domain-containing protein [Pseudobutyrivibrio sp.]MBQ8490065.1 DUF3990 domain-containing protein [Pseudobutyrivibrio sp.]
MILYHGTTIEIKEPKIIKSEIGRDFGFAFYTTDIQEQAERWAIRRAKIQNRTAQKKVLPVVNIYEWQPSDECSIKEFVGASLEWLDMVVNCRSDINFKHGYDIVSGKIADDNVGETVSYVLQGIMRKEDAVERLKFEKINNQIAFCSEKAIKSLKFIKSYIVEN